jgi:hypothetical protein
MKLMQSNKSDNNGIWEVINELQSKEKNTSVG